MYKSIEKFGYKYIKFLRKGSHGAVIKAYDPKHNRDVAVKIISKSRTKDKINQEINIMNSIEHTNIMSIICSVEDDDNVYIIMEYIDGVELFDIMRKKKLSEHEIFYYFYHILTAIEYLHSKSICHRDIKPENILIDKNNRVVIYDFGISKIVKPYATTSCGSLHYVAPEVITSENKKKYNAFFADIWSLGICLYVLATNKLPFGKPDTSIYDVINLVCEGKYTIPKEVDSNLQNLINKILQKNPKKRYTISQIKKHKWFKNCVKKYIKKKIKIFYAINISLI